MSLSTPHLLALIALILAVLSIPPWPNVQPHWGIAAAVLLVAIAILIS